jgi:hypothetical protein
VRRVRARRGRVSPRAGPHGCCGDALAAPAVFAATAHARTRAARPCTSTPASHRRHTCATPTSHLRHTYVTHPVTPASHTLSHARHTNTGWCSATRFSPLRRSTFS